MEVVYIHREARLRGLVSYVMLHHTRDTVEDTIYMTETGERKRESRNRKTKPNMWVQTTLKERTSVNHWRGR